MFDQDSKNCYFGRADLVLEAPKPALTETSEWSARMASLSQARVCEYFNYDPLSGHLYHKERPRSEFDSLAFARHMDLVGKIAGSPNRQGYVKVHVDGKYYSAHRVIWLMTFGEWPKYPQFEIDHINGLRHDNRLSNLRKVSKSQNQRNGSKRVNNTSGIHGVNWKPKYNSKPGDGRWVARIWNGPHHVYLGAFKSIREAEIARKAAERVLGFTGADRDPYEEKTATRGNHWRPERAIGRH